MSHDNIYCHTTINYDNIFFHAAKDELHDYRGFRREGGIKWPV